MIVRIFAVLAVIAALGLATGCPLSECSKDGDCSDGKVCKVTDIDEEGCPQTRECVAPAGPNEACSSFDENPNFCSPGFTVSCRSDLVCTEVDPNDDTPCTGGGGTFESCCLPP